MVDKTYQDFLQRFGLRRIPTASSLTDEEIVEVCQKYKVETGGWPRANSGDAFKWVGFPLTWMGVDQRVGSLSKFLIKHGLTKERSLTDEEIRRVCVAYHEEVGKWPTQHSGDASQWFGFKVTWGAIGLRVGGIRNFLIPKTLWVDEVLTDRVILSGFTAYRAEMGRFPNSKSGDLSKWFGFPITWAAVEGRVGSLHKFQIKHGLKEPKAK